MQEKMKETQEALKKIEVEGFGRKCCKSNYEW